MSTDRGLSEALAAAYPELDEVAAAAPDPVYLVGGAVRDLLVGRGRADIDLAVEGDPTALAAALGATTLVEHQRFGTMKIEWRGEELDLATTRRETYAEPGALPTVELEAPIRTDLARRDFTVNAMAVPLAEPRELLDPYDGQADLEARLLRVIHERSFGDDPTRAIRAARYAARFGFGLERRTEELLRAADLETVTAERQAEELRRLAQEETGVKGLELLVGWGLVSARARGDDEGALPLAREVDRLLGTSGWAGEVDRADAILLAAIDGVASLLYRAWDPVPLVADLAAARPCRPSEGAVLVRGQDPLVLLLARAQGAAWLDDWLRWREVTLEITGADLTAAGLSGPAVGAALDAALAAKLDGDAPTRADELRVALATADTNR
jgi:tRNA nucleotidyltransferase (CCA-adding enzyme)